MKIKSLMGKKVRIKRELIQQANDGGAEYFWIDHALKNFIDDYHSWTGTVLMDFYGVEPPCGHIDNQRWINTEETPKHMVIIDRDTCSLPILFDADILEIVE